MFTDTTTIKVGEHLIKINRLTLREIREAHADFTQGNEAFGDEAVKLVNDHCSLADSGKPIDPEQLSLPQMRKILNELVGIPEGSPISDFIGLLC